jgi:hypothetical protein
MWKVVLTKQANIDAKKLTAAGLKAQSFYETSRKRFPREESIYNNKAKN